MFNSEVTDPDEYEDEDHLPSSILKSLITSARLDSYLAASILHEIGGGVVAKAELQSTICSHENLFSLEGNI